MLRSLLVCLLLLFSLQLVAAQSTSSSKEMSFADKARAVESEPMDLSTELPAQAKRDEESVASKVGVTVVWLLFIIALIYALAYAFKRLAPPKAGLTNNDAIEVLCKQYIDPKQKLAVVKIHNRVLILGVGSNGITKISEFSDAADVEHFTSTFSLDRDNLFSRMLNSQGQKLAEGQEEDFDQKLDEVRSSLKNSI